jgi:gamma-F420-2:alpha-L-glutamate ligase
MAELAVRVTRALGLDVAGIDILFDTAGYRICEANSSPGFQGLEKACGISVPDAIFAGMRERLGLPSRPRGSSWRRFISSLRRSLGDTQHQADSANP